MFSKLTALAVVAASVAALGAATSAEAGRLDPVTTRTVAKQAKSTFALSGVPTASKVSGEPGLRAFRPWRPGSLARAGSKQRSASLVITYGDQTWNRFVTSYWHGSYLAYIYEGSNASGSSYTIWMYTLNGYCAGTYLQFTWGRLLWYGGQCYTSAS